MDGAVLARTASLLLAAATLAALGACGPPPPPPPPPWLEPNRGMVGTRGVTIVAEDRSFRLVAGEQFETPFHGGCVLQPTTTNFTEGEGEGAKRVLVKHPSAPQLLHGLLGFCAISPQVQGPESRSYEIEIPESYVAATQGGRVSVVFAFTGYQASDGRGGSADSPAWVLWLSEQPFP